MTKPRKAIQRIMVGVDGSDGANRAIDFAAELAKAVGGDLLIATIAAALSGDEARQFARAEGGIGDMMEAMADSVLHSARERARSIGVSKIKTQTGWRDVAESLLDIAARNEVDMIVLGRRGRGQMAGLLLGSVSQKLVSLALCPVLVVP
jgi:nucleotide-binding universal stress UspA family protein